METLWKPTKSEWVGESGGRAEMRFHQRIAEFCRLRIEDFSLDLTRLETRRVRRIQQSSDEIKVPPARRSRRPTVFPLTFHRTFCLNPFYFTIDWASEVLKIQILDASGPRSSKHYANYALRELRIRNLDTSGLRSSLHYANHALWELGMGILDTPGQSFSVFSAVNRPTPLSSSGSIHKMMTSRVRR